MGSLMSGWDSPVLSSKQGIYKRNRSLTKEEIESYWKSKQKTIDEHLKEITESLSNTKDQEMDKVEEFTGLGFKRSNSMPHESLRIKDGLVGEISDDTSLDILIKKKGWWTRSNWAFLNEPPVAERPTSSYVTQFHVANLATSKSQAGDGIATN